MAGPTSGVRVSPRTRNKRGEGAKLREAIVAAAGEILESTGSDEAVTLRAVARGAGVSAPAIYAHFDGPKDIVVAVVVRTFAELASALHDAGEGEDDPVAHVTAVSRAYLDFAAQRPAHYRVLFERHRVTPPDDDARAANTVAVMVGADAFDALVSAVDRCIRSGASASDDPVLGATRLWIGLHGQATLIASMPWFPWPDRDELCGDIVARLVGLSKGERCR